MIQDAPNINHLWTRLLVEELRRNGVDTFYISPGSRSTPLTLAAAQTEGVQTYVHFDERGAAFAAMGHAMGSERPVALICTSGTAAANYLPAVVEASQSGIPLIVLTADRPPELTDAGANQAIDQIGLYRNFTRWEHALPCPTTAMPAQALLTAIDQACFRATGHDPGPVHINCPFREPLAPTATGDDWSEYLAPLERWLDSDEPYTLYAEAERGLSSGDVEQIDAILRDAERGLIVIGRLARECDRLAALDIVKALQWPTHADVTSGIPLIGTDGLMLPNFDAVFASERFVDFFRPDVVLHLGGGYISKRLHQHIQQHLPLHYIRVCDHSERDDPEHVTTMRHSLPVSAFKFTFRLGEQDASTEWQNKTASYSFKAFEILRQLLDGEGAISEPAVLRYLCMMARPEHALFLGNSMPVRDANTYAMGRRETCPVIANRGASGIDGNIATAFGYGQGSQKRMTIVLGDIAALHDLNSLALLGRANPPITVVIINNDGGGVFHFLPIAEEDTLFEQYFGTPHGLTFKHAAAQFGITYDAPVSMTELLRSHNSAMESENSAIIELRTERRENLRLHKEILESVCEAIDRGK